MLQPSAIAPARLTRPKVGRRPVTPQRAAGDTIDPQVSEPIVKPPSPAAVAAPGPAIEPPEPPSRWQGFLILPRHQTWPHASSPIVSLAGSTAPARSRRRTTVAPASIT